MAQKYLANFGTAAFCGFGRVPPDELHRVLKEHQMVVESAG
jgi:hypothetical protein